MIEVEAERIKGKMVVPPLLLDGASDEEGQDVRRALPSSPNTETTARGEHIDGLTLSIRELEQFTGLDFFYHLPDDIEQAVETTDPHSAASRRLWWKQ